MSHPRQYLDEVHKIIDYLDITKIDEMVTHLIRLQSFGGRLFLLGVGGSAANASHAVNDFRKIAGIEAYAPTDNVAELTARTNDEGWASTFVEWLKGSRLTSKDAVFVLSVGGGSLKASYNIERALAYAVQAGAKILGIVGRDGGYTKHVADVCVLIPIVNPDHVTPHAEAFQSIILHLLVSHPALRRIKWPTDVNPG